ILMGFTLVFSPRTNTRHWVLLMPVGILLSVELLTPVARTPWRLCLVGMLLLLGGLTLPPGTRATTILLDANLVWSGWGGPRWVILLSLLATLWGGLAFARELASRKNMLF